MLPSIRTVLSGVPLALLSAACAATLDGDGPRGPRSVALPPPPTGALVELFGAPAPDGPSRFAPLDRADEGLDARLALVAAAESSIDVQSYLWHPDASGGLLLDRLLEAADRGVRVRLLIDGFRLEGREAFDEALDLHPNLELRVFNPTVHRGGLWRAVELAENLERLDHRMHNKLLVADGTVAVFGGRNVGDEYFGLGEQADFRDFDLLASGPVVEELGLAFDGFWNGRWTVPVGDLVAPPAEAERAATHAAARTALAALHASDRRLDARRARSRAEWLGALARARAALVEGRARVLHDEGEPDVPGATGLMAQGFERALAAADGDVWIVVAYLVPDGEFLDQVRRHTEAGHRVRILTNSYLSTNQPLAHTFYAAARDELLAAGAELYELRGDAWSHVHHRSPGSRARKLGLHAKSAVFGTDHVLVGSMNLDPRSMVLNTELGVLIESEALAGQVRACLAREFAERNAWRVGRHPDGGLRWRAQGVVLDADPAMGEGEHAREWFLRLLPLRGEV